MLEMLYLIGSLYNLMTGACCQVI